MIHQATPKLSEDKVKQCVDARLGGDYPPKAVAKVRNQTFHNLRLCLRFRLHSLFLTSSYGDDDSQLAADRKSVV